MEQAKDAYALVASRLTVRIVSEFEPPCVKGEPRGNCTSYVGKLAIVPSMYVFLRLQKQVFSGLSLRCSDPEEANRRRTNQCMKWPRIWGQSRLAVEVTLQRNSARREPFNNYASCREFIPLILALAL